MNKVILDCDNTFGMPLYDIDDGLTLMFLLGQSNIDLLGTTLTYGNSSLAKVFESTSEMKRKLRLEFSVYCDLDRDADLKAGEFLAKTVNQYPYEVTVIATGALTNLLTAAQIDKNFFKKVKQIIVMGGIMQPLIINNEEVDEVNFSCDPKAAEAVLLSEAPVYVMNGHMTSEAYFSEQEYLRLIKDLKGNISHDAWEWINKVISDWCHYNQAIIGKFGFCNWDMTTVMYLLYPELFSDETYYLDEIQDQLIIGKMTFVTGSNFRIHMPAHINNLDLFNEYTISGIVAGITKSVHH